MEFGDGAEFLSVAGASAAAVIITKAVRMVKENLSTAMTRGVAIFSAVVLLIGGHLERHDEITFVSIVGALLAGLTAGLSAVAAVDTARHGIDYQVEDRDG